MKLCQRLAKGRRVAGGYVGRVEHRDQRGKKVRLSWHRMPEPGMAEPFSVLVVSGCVELDFQG